MNAHKFYLVELGGDAVELRMHTGIALLCSTQCLTSFGKVCLVLLQLNFQLFLCGGVDQKRTEEKVQKMDWIGIVTEIRECIAMERWK